MYKILIVDDEVLVRVGFRTYINWEEYGFIIVEEAENGREALEKCRNLSPDIVITDIKMPYIDGIQLMEILSKDFPWIKTVVLSCYDDFELVKQAMKLGAYDYILKPTMEAENIISILNGLKNIINNESTDGSIRHTNVPYPESKTVIIENLLKEVILNNSSEALNTIIKTIPYLSSKNRIFCICLLCLDEQGNPQNNNPINKDHIYGSIRSIIENTTKSELFCIDTFNRRQQILVFNSDSTSRDNFAFKVKSIVKNLQSNLQNYLNIGVSFCVSETAHGISCINNLYTQTQLLLDRRFYFSPQSVLIYNNQAYACSDNRKPDFAIKNELILTCFDEQDKKGLLDYLTVLFDNLYEARPSDIESVKKLCIQILFLVELHYDDNEEVKSLFEKSNYYNEIRNSEYLLSIKKLILHLLNEVYDIVSIMDKNFDSTINKAIDYINNNYSKNISLKTVAHHAGLSRNYFSNLFKQQVGRNFIDYVNSVRLQKAKKLLCNPQLKVYEVASAVGIDNTRHFCNIFKKNFGITPKEFQKHNH